jgi:hypothetical protein
MEKEKERKMMIRKTKGIVSIPNRNEISRSATL